MTPEERASEWMGSPYTADEGEANARLAIMFRDAENDALERAAHRAEAFDQNVADAIREMKPPKGGKSE